MPEVSFGASLRDGLCGDQMFAPAGVSLMQRLYDKAQKSNHPFPLRTGDYLPLFERGSGLIRIVEDFSSPATWRDRLRFLSKITHNLPADEFDQRAEIMLSDSFYDGEDATTVVIDHSTGRKLSIGRTVSYLTGSVSGSELEAINSGFLKENPLLATHNEIYPELRVGYPYRSGRSGKFLMKIVGAEVLVPGRVKRVAKKALFGQVQPVFALNPLGV